MLTIKDLTTNKDLDRKAMANVSGGMGLDLFSGVSIPSFSEQIAATTALGGGGINSNSMMNVGTNYADNGSQVVAPVFMNSSQRTDNDITQFVLGLALQSVG